MAFYYCQTDVLARIGKGKTLAHGQSWSDRIRRNGAILNEKDDDIQGWGSLLVTLFIYKWTWSNHQQKEHEYSQRLEQLSHPDQNDLCTQIMGQSRERTRSNYSFLRPCISILGATRLQAADIRPWLTSLEVTLNYKGKNAALHHSTPITVTIAPYVTLDYLV